MKTARAAVAGVLTAVAASMAPAQPPHPASLTTPAAAKPTGLHDFDFLVGEWRVHHRRIQAGTREWVEFDGTCSHRKLIGGSANMDDWVLNSPRGAYRAIALRSYDDKSGLWAIWWLDGRYAAGPLGAPVKGRFENGAGAFYSDYTADGKPMRVRFTWSHITPISARWEQTASSDGGKTWETNWIMNLKRVSS